MVPYAHELIEYSMLNKQELDYLKNYYQKIKAKIYPLLSRNACNWLIKQVNFIID